jgi:hypothetical protein
MLFNRIKEFLRLPVVQEKLKEDVNLALGLTRDVLGMLNEQVADLQKNVLLLKRENKEIKAKNNRLVKALLREGAERNEIIARLDNFDVFRKDCKRYYAQIEGNSAEIYKIKQNADFNKIVSTLNSYIKKSKESQNCRGCKISINKAVHVLNEGLNSNLSQIRRIDDAMRLINPQVHNNTKAINRFENLIPTLIASNNELNRIVNEFKVKILRTQIPRIENKINYVRRANTANKKIINKISKTKKDVSTAKYRGSNRRGSKKV